MPIRAKHATCHSKGWVLCIFPGFSFSTAKSKVILFHRPGSLSRSFPLFLYDQRLPVVTELKFFGMVFDATLSWGPHVKALRASCQSSFDLLRFLSYHRWDVDRITLLRLYTALILSKLNYSAVVYASTAPHFLALLNPVQSQALRLASRAFRSSPVPSLEMEANVMPMDLRQELIAIRSFLRA